MDQLLAFIFHPYLSHIQKDSQSFWLLVYLFTLFAVSF